jgi:hypothetical protein
MRKTDDSKTHKVRLTDDLIAKCEHWAAEASALHAMPWTREQLTEAEREEWLASRKEAGSRIEIETCELGQWPANDCDPYGIEVDRYPEIYVQVGTNRFVRSSESRGWVWEGDLPSNKERAMYQRIYREADTYENYLKRPKEPAELWRAKFYFWRMVENYSCSIKWEDEDREAAVRKLKELSEALRKEQELHPDWFDHVKGDRAVRSASALVGSIVDTIFAAHE